MLPEVPFKINSNKQFNLFYSNKRMTLTDEFIKTHLLKENNKNLQFMIDSKFDTLNNYIITTNLINVVNSIIKYKS